MKSRLARVIVVLLCGTWVSCQQRPDTPAGATRPNAQAGVAEPLPQLYNTASVADRPVYRRAVELTIWGVPAVSMTAVRQSLKRDLDADLGDVVYFSNVLEPRHQFLTANNQTPYILTVFDLRQGPMVLEVPPASSKTVFFGSAIDSWQVPLATSAPVATTPARAASTCSCPLAIATSHRPAT